MIHDVVIVGYGPTGMLATILLGRAGRRVAVLERHKTLYNLPRVGIVHDDILRIFQEIGIIERIWPATRFLPTYELAKHSQVLLSSDVAPYATHGWPEYISIYQPAFEYELDAIVKSMPNVEVFQGQKAVALSQDIEHVEVAVEDEKGIRRLVQGRYLIGADGGNSFVREALGVVYENLGFDQDWLVIDGKEKKPRRDLPMMRQFCEPEQPGVTLAMGPQHRRWSFMIFPDESVEGAMRSDSVWRRLDRPEGATPDEYDLIRIAAYKFQSLYAKRWRVGRVFLAGDSAHQMPPFLAQGLCSGFRDAYNLGWKLDSVMQGVASPDFLDTYMAERGPNARATIVESMRVGQYVNERDPEKVLKRDAELLALQATKDQAKRGGKPQLIAFRVPGFTAGFISRSKGTTVRGAGDSFIQGKVRYQGREGLFDDVVGRGFMIVSRKGNPAAVLKPDDRNFWRSLGGGTVRISHASTGDASGDVVDLENRYWHLMDEYGCDVIVKRPDNYIFCACPSLDDLAGVIANMREQLTTTRR